ncbi:MAG: relaxase domain-containing protein [Opitutaceae bacterium]
MPEVLPEPVSPQKKKCRFALSRVQRKPANASTTCHRSATIFPAGSRTYRRQNRHPTSGEPLTPRDHANRVAFFDIQLSAPKDVSVLAMVGGDVRVREAFVESVKIALAEMERFAAVRERRGNAAMSEEIRLTGNFVGALFVHDTSRDLDPQLHGHAVAQPARYGWNIHLRLDAHCGEQVSEIVVRDPCHAGCLACLVDRFLAL